MGRMLFKITVFMEVDVLFQVQKHLREQLPSLTAIQSQSVWWWGMLLF